MDVNTESVTVIRIDYTHTPSRDMHWNDYEQNVETYTQILVVEHTHTHTHGRSAHR